jgi:hypothetical protein
VHAPHRLRVVAAAMDAILKVEQAGVEVLAVLFPRDPIHSGRRALTTTAANLTRGSWSCDRGA